MIVMFFCFYWYGVNRDLHVLTHSFPTRRSSELWDAGCRRCAAPFQQYWDDDDIGAPHVERDVDKVHRTRFWPCPADTLPGCGVGTSASVGALEPPWPGHNGLRVWFVGCAAANCPCVHDVRTRWRYGVVGASQAARKRSEEHTS